jgi:hypothetical protein
MGKAGLSTFRDFFRDFSLVWGGCLVAKEVGNFRKVGNEKIPKMNTKTYEASSPTAQTARAFEFFIFFGRAPKTTSFMIDSIYWWGKHECFEGFKSQKTSVLS